MPSSKPRVPKVGSEGAFEPVAYRKAIADMFGALDHSAQRDLVDRIAILPRHIHAMASRGEIPVVLPSLGAIAT
jgi:hypothetical protein